MTDPSRNSDPSGKKTEVPIGPGNGGGGVERASFSGHRTERFVNPPDASNPDAATLREQWRYAIRLYSRWYSHAWGTAILAGVSFFALGWVIKGENPIRSLRGPEGDDRSNSSTSESGGDRR